MNVSGLSLADRPEKWLKNVDWSMDRSAVDVTDGHMCHHTIIITLDGSMLLSIVTNFNFIRFLLRRL